MGYRMEQVMKMTCSICLVSGLFRAFTTRYRINGSDFNALKDYIDKSFFRGYYRYQE
jgi:hypothetical protein